MLRKRPWLLFLIALILRLGLQGWDAGSSGSSIHPDERQVGFVTEKSADWFSDPGFYAYGSLHFQAVRAGAALLGLGDSLRGLVVGGRGVSLLASMLALVLGWLIARHAWDRRTAFLFLLIAAWVPLDLQQSHFATVEAHHAAWVMAALASCYWLAASGRTAAAAAAGAAVGASLAVKVASLALGLPLAVALLLAVHHRPQQRAVASSALELFRLAATTAAAGVATFWLSQPWAFAAGRPPLVLLGTLLLAAISLSLAISRSAGARRALAAVGVFAGALAGLQAMVLAGVLQIPGANLNPAYLLGVGEQVRMVMGDGDLPYVRVYAHTLPILYPLRELALWGWGATLLLATMAAVAAGSLRLMTRWRQWLAGRWNKGSIMLLLLLAWIVPMALRLGTLHVKYLRYWQPLVVPAVLISAWWLARLPARTRRWAVPTVVGGTVLWGLCFAWAFIEPHPHRTASRWLAPMLNDGQAVAFESWDESLPLELARGHVEHLTLPSYDLPDDEAKTERWAAELAQADWVVLTSNRVFRTVLSNPQRFPYTGRLYRLLLAGEAGFVPMAKVSRGPRIFGLHWPVQLADESFVNYDFPQVVVLRRASPVAAETLVERVSRPLPFLETLDFQDVERSLLATLPSVPAVPTAASQLVDVAIWLAVFCGLGLASWVLLLPLIARLPDAGLGLALGTGWLGLSWIMWMGSELRLWSTGAATASWLFIATLAAGAIAARKRRREIAATLARRRPAMLKVAGVAALVWSLFVIVRAWNPAIYWGEKPMDFAFLNAFLRAPAWPPGEPWMAGMPLHYYYFGEVLAAVPILVSGCSASVGYNLIAATIPALGAAILAGFGLAVARRRRWFAAAALPLLVLLTGNLAWPWLLDLAKQGKWFDLWWATSRVIPGFAIDEYPLWTALFADLHGHFIALPVLLATLGWGWLTVRATDRRWMAAAGLCGVGAAAVVATNPWDLFVLTGALGIGALAAARRPLVGLGRLAAAAVFSTVAAAPFVVELVNGFNAGAGGRGVFLTEADFAPAWAVLRHFGLFLIPLAVLALANIGRRSWLVFPAAGLGVAAGLGFGSTAAALALAAAALFTIAAAVSRHPLDRLGWAMAVFGSLAVAACERFTLIDRMNTLFKVYNGVWPVLAIALAVMLLRTRGPRRRLLVAVWLPLQVAAALNLPLGIAQGWRQPRIESPRPTLDGQAFLAQADPQTWFLVRTLLGVALPGEVVAESAGPYYSQHTRIVMHTGQPTVVGWEWHLSQRGQSVREIGERAADLETLYSGRQPRARRAVIDRYRVRWVVLADLERQRYGLETTEDLRDVPGLLQLGHFHGAALYRVLPQRGSEAPPIVPALELPVGAEMLGVLPLVRSEVVRSLDLDDRGALAVLPDNTVVELDAAGRLAGTLPSPSCDVSSAVRWRDDTWTVCLDGRLLRLQNQQWITAGRIEPGLKLTAGDALWAWGSAGLWRRDDATWRQLRPGAVTAASANGAWIVWSDGTTVLIGGRGAPQAVPGALDGVRAVAWQGTSPIAVDAAGLHRSGGAVLPWRPILPGAGRVAAVAGHGPKLWAVREEGLILEAVADTCPSPWAAVAVRGAEPLREPRDLAVSPEGWFAVADTRNHRIVWYGLLGVCLDAAGSEGAAPGSFREPSGLALAEDGTLAVTDTWNGRIQLLRRDGSTEVFGAGLFGPRDALWTGDGGLLVADTGNRRLLRFDPPGWRQQVLAELPGPVVGLAEAAGLVAAAVPVDGAISLIDAGTGTVVRRLEVPGWQSRDQQEGYLAALPSGELAATAPATGELWIVDPNGDALPRLLRSGLPGATGIAPLPSGELLISLTWENRLVRVPLEP